MPQIAKIRLLTVRREFDRGYSYVFPEEMAVSRGCIAAVPFGKADRPAFGVVTEICDEPHQEPLKSLLYVLEPPYVLNEETVELCEYFAGRLLCSVGELARAALPSGLTLKVREFLTLRTDEHAASPEADPDNALLTMLLSGARVEITGANRLAAEQLIRARIARKAYLPQNAANQKFVRVVRLTCDPANLPEKCFARVPLRKVQIYQSLLRYLADIPARDVPEKELCDRFCLSKDSISSLEKRGLVAIEARQVYRATYEEYTYFEPGPIPLNDDQRAAYDTLSEKLSSDEGSAALLYGITGSGKTRVMLKLVDRARYLKRGVIFLVPEIGLTSRSAKELMRLFGDDVCVLHSGLSEGERHDAWVALKTGQKHIVLGTRSAIFAPVENLGLILMDEEQDQSYNADNAPRYHARDIARFRAAHSKALLLLASATPDIETYHKAVSGVYTLCSLPARASGASLPSVTIVDLKEDLKAHPDRLIGAELEAKIASALSRNEQCLLFMNRRGYQYAPFCASCGHVITCPNCSVALTLHSFRGRYACCHYCGYTIPAPSKCPDCQAEHLFFRGFGTQRLEEEVKTLFPKARVLRMDADTVGQKYAHQKIVEKFSAHGGDILLGTQMIAKGHDFPNVTLVGVVMADTSLYLGDYRATEETFSLLTQVIGRAGRAERPGHAVIQTLNPQHEVFALSATQDYDAFYRGEIALRKAVLYPPFCHLSVFTLTSEDELLLNRVSVQFNERFAEELELHPDVKLIVYGPIDPALLRLNNRYRKKFVMKHQNDTKTRALYRRLIRWFSETQPTKITLTYDATPNRI